ncbi:MAG: lytic murein transglycosylase B [Burkholderiales bacterium]|nr:lytic murein transglycosylase B [Burkholderiales bacterium]
MLAACSSPQRPSSNSSPPGAATAPEPQASAATAPEATAAASSASAPTANTSPSIEAKPLRRNGADYAQRDDARALAQTIARDQHLPFDWVWSQLSQARYRDAVAKLIMPAASSTFKNWAAYKSRFIEPIRIRAGQAFIKNYATDLKRAEQTYGVPASVIAGVLGVETIYGRQTGNFRVLDVLSTLSLDFPTGRSDRSAFFRNELGEFFKLCDEQKLDPVAVQGSYAGAIGWPQFMPSSIRRHAVDFDNDGRIDLQRSPVDAIGSVAKYLADHGWQTGQPTHYEITPPQDADSLSKLLAPDILPTFTPAQMSALGTVLPPQAQAYAGPLALVQLLNGSDTPTMIAGTHNFYVITRYNQSSYYALAVILLGQAVSAP